MCSLSPLLATGSSPSRFSLPFLPLIPSSNGARTYLPRPIARRCAVHACVPGAPRRLAQPAGSRRPRGRASTASAASSRARGAQHPKPPSDGLPLRSVGNWFFFLYNKFGSQYNNIFIVKQLLEYFDKTTMPADTALWVYILLSTPWSNVIDL
jgi:hypothetical protein